MTDEHITLDADGDVQLPTVDVLTGRAFLTGKSGAGKSNSASVIAEELLDQSLPLLIVDTDGEYWGLKEKYEILHAGADEECDIQVGPEHGEKLATLALEQNVPIILDVSGYIEAEEAKALIREVAHHLFTKEKHLKKPFLLMVEEIHEYVPEGGGLDDAGEMLVKVGKRGRKRGLGIIGISQRPADVKKDFITQANWILWHRLTWDNDTEVVRRVVDRDHAEAVTELADGEAFLQADFLDSDITRVQVRRKATFDAGATPDLGEIETPDLKSVGDDLLGELEEISEQKRREQDRIAELETTVEQREAEIEALQEELERARDMQDMAQQFTEALTASEGEGGEAIQAKVDEIREEKNQQIRELEATVETLRETKQELQADLTDATDRIEQLERYERAVENLDELEEAVQRMNEALGVETDGQGEKARKRLKQREERINELEAELQRARDRLADADAPTVPSDYEAFVDDAVVREAIEDAKTADNVTPRYVKGVVATLLQEGEPVDYDTIAEYLAVSDTTHVSKAASALQSRGVLKKVQKSPAIVDFDTGAIEEIKAKQQRRQQAEAIMEDL